MNKTLTYDKAKVEDYLQQAGSVDPTRNIAFHSGCQYQLNQDQQATNELVQENARLHAENTNLKEQLARTSKKVPKAPKA